MNKRVRLVVTVVIAMAAIAGLLWEASRRPPSQTLALPNGQQYKFIGAAWGTNNLQPGFAARWVARLPTPLANFIRQRFGNRLGGNVDFFTSFHPMDSASELVLSYVPADVATVDIMWTVQKLRTVEFLVKPPKVE